ncbi:MAG: glycogen-binding domain-containing protein [Treponema sp.]|nr:glycogen-binding domain-containing protein [Treponema sp.]
MKTISKFVLFVIFVSLAVTPAFASEWENFDVINRLLSIQTPGAPVVFDNFVIFTADSALRRVGVAFAHEHFGRTHWFRPLFIPQDIRNPVLLPGEREPSPYMDSGIQFYVFRIPDHMLELEYRLVINGLWTTDPSNPSTRRDPASGLTMSILNIPPRTVWPNPLHGLPEGLRFQFRAPPGEIVTVAGCFNGWDPFMFELREGPAGLYSTIIQLPPGTYQYVFFHRGRRFTDPYNPRRIYALDGSAASVIIVP